MKPFYILLIIISIGLLLRVININNNPPSLYGDELTITLDAYSLLKTGHDQLGNFLPLTFPMGAGRPAGYVYSSIPFIALFGPTALGVRALSILSGTGIIILLYLIGKKMFSERVGLLAAAIGAVSPWDISLSRGGFEAHFALFLALLGAYLFISAKQKPLLYIFSAISFGLTLHTYPTYKVSLLLFLSLLCWYMGGINKAWNRKHFLIGAIVLILLGVLSLSQTFIGGSETRFADINIFSQDTLKASIEQKINLERQTSQLPKPFLKLFHNKPIEYSKVFIENYLQNFSPEFLVLYGDRNPRHNMATIGEIYLVEVFLIIMGLLVYWHREKKIFYFLLFWIILAPIPTAIVDLPHALRSSFMMPPLVLLSALGLAYLIERRKKFVISLICFVFIIQFIFFIQKLHFLAPNKHSVFWSYPAKLASQIAIREKNTYGSVILSDKIESIEFAYPIYAKINPNEIINQNQNKGNQKREILKKFGNVFVGNISDNGLMEAINDIQGSVLYIGSKYEGQNLSDFEIIDGLDGQTALVVKKKR